MALTNAPRALARFEYRLLRRPSLFVEQRYLSRLPEDHPRRLLVERALGSLDTWAGRVFSDPEVSSRGQLLLEGSETLRQARELEEDAERRRKEAESQLEQEKEQASQERREAIE